ncbi:FAD-binding oxidoreductase [Marivita sp.]|uniref:FAD-binding oxidoreductase n=1 Tax=Marivita sp. TaxID=2003365 RepID=UPI003A84FB81
MAKARKSKVQVLPQAARKDLEAILGARYVETDPAVMTGYSWYCGNGEIPGRDKFTAHFPIAIVLPSTTEEVAEIVKACLRHKLHFKAHSTGYGSMAVVPAPNTVAIDLRRMNTLEIVPKDRMAIIGPYATAGMIQAEALEHGLTCHIVGAGPSHSPLASATSLFGVGVTGLSTGVNMRNLLAWEWVSPTGEIIRGGSAEGDKGWFAGEGPGPGTRGLIRGLFGAAGGLGVFTKIGIKLYPVANKGQLQHAGQHPQLGTKVPELSKLYQIVWPDWDSQTKATFELMQDDLCFAMLRMPPNSLAWTVTSSNTQFVEQDREGTIAPVADPMNDKNWTVLISSRSPEEHAWRQSCIEDIVTRTGARFIELAQEDEWMLYHNLVTAQYIARVLRPAGGIMTSFGVFDSFHFLPRAMEMGEKAQRGQNKPGGHLTTGQGEEQWVWPNEGRYMWSENIYQFDPASEASRAAATHGFLAHVADAWREGSTGMVTFTVGPMQEVMGERVGRAHHQIRKIKNHFDPGDNSKSKEYVIPKVHPVLEKILPPLRPLLSSEPVLKFASKGVAKNGL